jgi:uncharacterized membrane protein
MKFKHSGKQSACRMGKYKFSFSDCFKKFRLFCLKICIWVGQNGTVLLMCAAGSYQLAITPSQKTLCMKNSMEQNTGTSRAQQVARWLLGSMLITAGTGHLTFVRRAFQAQVPNWVPVSKDLTVILSGVVEILLGMAIAFWSKKKVFWGWVAALFFVLVFPGNWAQYIHHRDAFGLNTDLARRMRLLMQPVLIAWALWGSGAWKAWRERKIS